MQTIGRGQTGNAAADMHHFVANQPMPPSSRYERRRLPTIGLADVLFLADPIALMKIDCEGGEYGFLRDAEALLKAQTLAQAPARAADLMAGQVRGRLVVKIA